MCSGHQAVENMVYFEEQLLDGMERVKESISYRVRLAEARSGGLCRSSFKDVGHRNVRD